MNKSNLKIDWCSHQAAKTACEKWHYSHALPDPKQSRLGVWEHGQFVGVVIFSRGVACSNFAPRLGLTSNQLCELSRVALTKHDAPVSRVLRIALMKLSQQSPGIKAVLSYADPNVNHVGGIYQASGWTYTGKSHVVPLWMTSTGLRVHDRSVSSGGVKRQFGVMKKAYKRIELVKHDQLPKHRYVFILDKQDKGLASAVEAMRKPYPKRVGGVSVSTGDHQSPGGGSSPTPALHS